MSVPKKLYVFGMPWSQAGHNGCYEVQQISADEFEWHLGEHQYLKFITIKATKIVKEEDQWVLKLNNGKDDEEILYKGPKTYLPIGEWGLIIVDIANSWKNWFQGAF